MATMYPSFDVPEELNKYLPADSFGDGRWWERKLYDAMRDELPEDWVVVHHRQLDDGQYRHECDFLVVVPGKGIVNLDAKGHGWGCTNARWYRERAGWREFDNPIDQAEKAVRTLNNTICAKVSGGEPWGGFGYLLVFSDPINNPAVEESFLGAAEEMINNGQRSWGRRLKSKIEEVLDRPAPGHHHRYFTPKMQKDVLSFLVPVSRPRQVNDVSFRIWDDQSHNALSIKQKRVSAELKKVDVVHVVGAAGTGKTVVAMSLLEECREQGKTALYVCYNKALCSMLKSENPQLIGSGNIAFTHFDALPSIVLPTRREIRKVVRFPIPPSGTREIEWKNYRTGIREALDHFSETQNGVFDLIVIDEAQDLSKENILSLYNLSGGERKIVVFSDKDQTIFSTEWDFSPSDFGEVSSVKLVLDENWRNSEPIHDHFKDYAEHDPPTTMIGDCDKPVQSINDIGTTLQKLILQEHRNPRDIVVLSSDWEAIDGIVGPIASTGCKVERLDGDIAEFRRKHQQSVMAATIQGFKGLESRIVILIPGSQGRRTQDEWDKLLYVGESRAKYELYIVSGKKTDKTIEPGTVAPASGTDDPERVKEQRQPNERTKSTVRLLLVSDIHNSGTDGMDPAGCDAAIVAGDFKNRGWSSCDPASRHDVNDDPFFKWCDDHPELPVFLVPGNHDRVVGRCPDWLVWPKNVIRLDESETIDFKDVRRDEDGAVVFKGLRLWGSPWSIKYHDDGIFSGTEDDLKRELGKAPDHLDVLVIHGPPRLEDKEGGSDARDGEHVGGRAAREAILEKKPRFVVCGHIHHGDRAEARLGGSAVLNVSRVYGEQYNTCAYTPAFAEFRTDGTLSVTPAQRI